MSKFEKFILNYGVVSLAYIFYGVLGALLLTKFGVSWTNIFIMLSMMVGASGFAYINGWYRGRFDEIEERTRILREENASSISGKNKSKTPRR